MRSRIVVIEGDITQQHVDAIVNAANRTLLGGGGVDGAIHRAAGPELLEACRAIGNCEAGDAKLTQGYGLPAKWVIHTVGPVWRGGLEREDQLLASCYRRALEIARDQGAHSIAFLAISTGAYAFPMERAAEIAVGEVNKFIAGSNLPETVFLVCFDRSACGLFEAALRSVSGY
jgi:O-acetyl-ADP-ribose deacetylase (regulator of RNase III)